jgi:hypothetical protein
MSMMGAAAASSSPSSSHYLPMFPQPADLMRLQQQQQPGVDSPYQMLLQREDDIRLREAEIKRAAARPPSRSRAPATACTPSPASKGGKGVRASPEVGRSVASYHPPIEATKENQRGHMVASSPQSALASAAHVAHGGGPYNLGLGPAAPNLAPWTPPVFQAPSSASFLTPPTPSAAASQQLTPTSVFLTTAHSSTSVSTATTTTTTTSVLAPPVSSSPLNLSLNSSGSQSFSSNSSSSSNNNSSTASDQISPSETVSRCTPYVPKQRPSARLSAGPLRTSTPIRPFVRPFEDDLSPATNSASLPTKILEKSTEAEENHTEMVVEVEHVTESDTRRPPYLSSMDAITSTGSAMSPCLPPRSSPKPDEQLTSGEEKGSGGGQEAGVVVHCPLELEDRKPEDQDSDYESMASDSSLRREGQQVLCPASGRLLLQDETPDLREAEDSDSGLREEEDRSSRGVLPSKEDLGSSIEESEGSTGDKKTEVPVLQKSPEEIAANMVEKSAGCVTFAAHRKEIAEEEVSVDVSASGVSGAAAGPDISRTSGVSPPDDTAACSPDSGLFREPGPEPTSREKLRYLRYFRLVTHSRKNGEYGTY